MRSCAMFLSADERLKWRKVFRIEVTSLRWIFIPFQARNQDFMWGGWEGANEAKVDPTTEMYFLFSDPFI